jgi:hypothetical protein
VRWNISWGAFLACDISDFRHTYSAIIVLFPHSWQSCAQNKYFFSYIYFSMSHVALNNKVIMFHNMLNNFDRKPSSFVKALGIHFFGHILLMHTRQPNSFQTLGYTTSKKLFLNMNESVSMSRRKKKSENVFQHFLSILSLFSYCSRSFYAHQKWFCQFIPFSANPRDVHLQVFYIDSFKLQ